jgi:hypothetical protein
MTMKDRYVLCAPICDTKHYLSSATLLEAADFINFYPIVRCSPKFVHKQNKRVFQSEYSKDIWNKKVNIL